MTSRNVVLYYAWSRPGEVGAPLEVIENRFPALFESRRMAYPRFEAVGDPSRFDQGVGGFLDHIMKQNFAAFVAHTQARTGRPAAEIERVTQDGVTPLDAGLLDNADTLIIISFDSLRTAQAASTAEVEAVRRFLAVPDHLVFVCPHHDIGHVPDLPHDARLQHQLADFLHHGDKSIPPQQGFGGFARSLLAGLGMPVENRFGLRPAAREDGTPEPIEIVAGLDRLQVLAGVEGFNLHPHLPQLERLGEATGKLDVLARQKIDLSAPPHPFTRERTTFDALLQSRPDVFPGVLFVGDTTLFSSTAGGVDNLQRLWTNLLDRPARS